MKYITLPFLFVLFAIHAASGKGSALPEDAVAKADLIVHIRVDDDVKVSRSAMEESATEGAKAAESTPDDYRHLATASLVRVFKGADGEKTIKIRHTNDFACPNVIYRKGEEYIVFLQKEPGSESYVTMEYYMGQFPVKNGTVANFYLAPEFRHTPGDTMPYERVAAYLKAAVEKLGEGSAPKAGAGGKAN